MSIRSILLKNLCRATLLLLLLMAPNGAMAQRQSPDAEQLGMALEYFQTGKYHESLLIFQRLDKRYKLNPRFRAYIALCYYYEWDYKKAVEYFEKTLPQLTTLAPRELSVYYYAAGESYFQMQQYSKALTYYEADMRVCYDREKGDISYRMGLCHMFLNEWQEAFDDYTAAENYYHQYGGAAGMDDRLAQIANMKRGCKEGIAAGIDIERSRMLKEQPTESSSSNTSPWETVTSSTATPWETATAKNIAPQLGEETLKITKPTFEEAPSERLNDMQPWKPAE